MTHTRARARPPVHRCRKRSHHNAPPYPARTTVAGDHRRRRMGRKLVWSSSSSSPPILSCVRAYGRIRVVVPGWTTLVFRIGRTGRARGVAYLLRENARVVYNAARIALKKNNRRVGHLLYSYCVYMCIGRCCRTSDNQSLDLTMLLARARARAHISTYNICAHTHTRTLSSRVLRTSLPSLPVIGRD